MLAQPLFVLSLGVGQQGLQSGSGLGAGAQTIGHLVQLLAQLPILVSDTKKLVLGQLAAALRQSSQAFEISAIQIEAASLEMRDKKKEATFAGNVKVVQGDTTMTAKSLVVFYDSGPAPAAAPAPNAKGAAAKGAKSAPMQAATPGPGGSSSIRRLEAKGNVVVTQKDQVVTGETAVFDTRANMITMLGGIVLTQGKNVLRGDRLMVDMTTGVSRVESDSGRVQGLFISSGGQGAPAIPGMPSSGPAPAPAPPNKPK